MRTCTMCGRLEDEFPEMFYSSREAHKCTACNKLYQKERYSLGLKKVEYTKRVVTKVGTHTHLLDGRGAKCFAKLPDDKWEQRMKELGYGLKIINRSTIEEMP